MSIEITSIGGGVEEEVATVTCHGCSCEIDDGESVTVDGDIYCHGCTSTCDHCGDNCVSDDTTTAEGRRGRDVILCSSCVGDNTFVCDDCDTVYYSNERSSSTTVDGNTICDDCRSEYYSCDDCGDLLHSDNTIYNEYDDSYYCENCAPHHNNHSIHSHDYKPHPNFHKTPNDKGTNPLYIGFELEIETSGNANSLAETINDDFFYCKRDGSLNDGFEVVTHPFTRLWFYENLKADKFKKMFDLSTKGCKSYDTTTCGLHFHMSKAHFTSLHLYKMMKLVYENHTEWQLISRRRGSEFDRWCGTNKSKSHFTREAKNKANHDTRYTALNITNHTVECRIFRGTLNKEAFIGNLEILFAMIDFTRITSLTNITFENYIKFIAEQKRYKFAKTLTDNIFEKRDNRDKRKSESASALSGTITDISAAFAEASQ